MLCPIRQNNTCTCKTFTFQKQNHYKCKYILYTFFIKPFQDTYMFIKGHLVQQERSYTSDLFITITIPQRQYFQVFGFIKDSHAILFMPILAAQILLIADCVFVIVVSALSTTSIYSSLNLSSCCLSLSFSSLFFSSFSLSPSLSFMLSFFKSSLPFFLF